MNKTELIKYLNFQINECKKLLKLERVERAYKGYLQGQIYAFELVLREIEKEKNPDCQEPNIFDEMLIHGGKLEGAEEKQNEEEVSGLRLYQEHLDEEMRRKAVEYSKGLPEGFKMTADTIVNEDGMTAVRFSIEKEEK